MDSADRVNMIGLVKEFSNTDNGAFLREFDWKAVPFWTEADKCNDKSDTLGIYHAAEDTIGLMEACDPELIASTYVHELRHASAAETRSCRIPPEKKVRPSVGDRKGRPAERKRF